MPIKTLAIARLIEKDSCKIAGLLRRDFLGMDSQSVARETNAYWVSGRQFRPVRHMYDGHNYLVIE